MILWSVLDWFCAYCKGESCFEVKTEADSNDVAQHPDEYSCLCNQCGRCFSSSDDLYRHMNIHVSKFVCTDCGECYGNNSKLAVHRRSHSGEKPFECTVCGKRFTASHHLVAHSRIHSGEKPYKCYVCDKAFTESGHLKRHMRVHTGYKPYKCSVCDKSFSDSRSLQRHLSWLCFVQTVLEWISSLNSICQWHDQLVNFWLTVCKTVRPMLSDRYQNETWYGGRPPRRRHCVRWGRSFPPPQKRGTAPNFRPVYCVQTVAHLIYCWAVVWSCTEFLTSIQELLIVGHRQLRIQTGDESSGTAKFPDISLTLRGMLRYLCHNCQCWSYITFVTAHLTKVARIIY